MVKKISLSRFTLRSTLILCITAIILIVIMFLLAAAYSQASSELVRQNEEQARFSEMYLRESLVIADHGLKLYDSSLDPLMEEGFSGYLAAYNESGGDISRIDLESLKASLNPSFSGVLDLYIINESGVIVASTVPSVMYLDFRNYPEFFSSVTRIREDDAFVADRIVRSVANTTEGTVIGQLRKFAFMPVPDHRYLLEMGLLMEGFESQRSELSYVEIADRIQEMNPSIERIRIFDINQNLILEQGVTPDTGLHTTQLSDIFTTGRDSTIKDTTTHQVIRYLYIDLKESSTVSDMSLVAEITYTLVPFESALSQILLYYVLIGIIAVVMGIAMAFSIARFLSKPIGDIIEDVEQIARGDLAHTIRSMPNPEFRKLEESINLMIGRIETYSRQLERDKAEIQIAAEIQRTFLPRREPVLDNFEISARNIPAQEVGGDYYDFIQLDDRNLGIVIADVAGKGIPAALFMALSRSIIRAVATRDKSLDEIIRESNDLITADASAGMFVTLFYCVLDSRSGHLVYVNAGHNPPLHYRNGTGTLHTLLPSGMAMGVMSGNTYSVGELDLAPGDVLVLYTDGVTEAFNMPGEEFGEGRLMDTVIASHDLRAGEILGTIFSRVHDFIGEAAQSDDITVVVIRHMLRSLNEKDEKSGMVPLS